MAKDQTSSAKDIEQRKEVKCQKCTLCSKEYLQPQYLNRHIKVDHPNASQSCEKCNESFTTLDLLTAHMKAVHITEDATCTICNLTFQQKSELDEHMLVHDLPNEKPQDLSKDKHDNEFKCLMCEKIYRHKYHLTRHVKSSHIIYL